MIAPAPERAHPYPRPFDGITTVRAAIDFVNEAFADQVEQSILDAATPNVAISGDSRVRDAFWALLPPEEQRRFFLRVAGNRRVWPRLKTLIGNPPYSFLRPEDEGVLRAGGICKGRVRMAHSEPTATGYAEFKPHYEDGAGRKYRILALEGARDGRLPWIGLVAGARVVADVRVTKREGKVKVQIARGAHGAVAMAGLVFPRVGDTLLLTLVPQLRRPATEDEPAPEPLRASVVLGRQKAVGSPIARLVLKIL